MVSSDINKDGLPDLLLGGNFYENNVQLGRSDGDFCSVLINRGKGEFDFAPHEGLQIKGQVRKILPISINHKILYLIARNNEIVNIVNWNSK
ncbi:MAG: hypothetical protein IPO92_20785 [Saprospiraceae bacterium]|nr:hypothetical protein [Saprospiraceae bacterium]